jgi:hypothetical protein
MENNIIELKPFIKMGVEKLREELHLLIDSTDEHFLKMIAALSVAYKNEDQIVGYRPDGTVITKTELVSEVEEGMEQIESGDYMTTKELREQLAKK